MVVNAFVRQASEHFSKIQHSYSLCKHTSMQLKLAVPFRSLKMATSKHLTSLFGSATQNAAAKPATENASLSLSLEARMATLGIHKQQDSRLLQLPGELRNMIYRYAVLAQDPMQLHLGMCSSSASKAPRPILVVL